MPWMWLLTIMPDVAFSASQAGHIRDILLVVSFHETSSAPVKHPVRAQIQ